MEDAWGDRGDEGRGVPAISPGEVATNLRSGDLRMGKPNSMINRVGPEFIKGPRTR